MWVRGACIYHGVQSVQVAGLSPLHAEQAVSWKYFDHVRSSGDLLDIELFLCFVMNSLSRIVAVGFEYSRLRAWSPSVAVRWSMGELGLLRSVIVELLSAISVHSLEQGRSAPRNEMKISLYR